MLKISAVSLIGNPEIPIHYTSWSQVEQALLLYSCHFTRYYFQLLKELKLGNVNRNPRGKRILVQLQNSLTHTVQSLKYSFEKSSF